jgi:hypothetical protein
MNGLIAMLTEAGVPQVLTWDEFKKPTRRVGWYKEMPENSVETHFWVITDGVVIRFRFSHLGIYKGMSVETP